jgi:hypothetical protein
MLTIKYKVISVILYADLYRGRQVSKSAIFNFKRFHVLLSYEIAAVYFFLQH